jgi:hypothetical protein
MTILNTPNARIFERMANAGKPSKKTKANRNKERKMIDTLVSLDKRRKAALGAGDSQALMEIAGEYAALGCPRLANEIIAEATYL